MSLRARKSCVSKKEDPCISNFSTIVDVFGKAYIGVGGSKTVAVGDAPK